MKRVKKRNLFISVKAFLKTGLVNLVLIFVVIASVTIVYSFFSQSFGSNTTKKIKVVKFIQNVQAGQKVNSDSMTPQPITEDQVTPEMITAEEVNEIDDIRLSQDKNTGDYLYESDIVSYTEQNKAVQEKLADGLHLVYLKSSDLYLPFPDLKQGDVISLYAYDLDNKSTVKLADNKVIQIIRDYQVETLSEKVYVPMYGLILNDEEVETMTTALGNSWFIQIVKNNS